MKWLKRLLVAAGILFLLYAFTVFYQEVFYSPPKGIPAYLEWKGDGTTLWQ